jgi:hypothetical protein
VWDHDTRYLDLDEKRHVQGHRRCILEPLVGEHEAAAQTRVPIVLLDIHADGPIPFSPLIKRPAALSLSTAGHSIGALARAVSFEFEWHLACHADAFAEYLGALWLRVGLTSFRSRRDDAARNRVGYRR